MTQKEFDDRMNELRRLQYEESAPLRREVAELNARRRSLGYLVTALLSQISAVRGRRDALELRLKEVGAKYYQMKKELIVSRPKAVAAEGGKD